MSERPTFLRLLDYQPVAEALFTHITSGTRPSLSKPRGFAMKKGSIRNRWGSDEGAAQVWSAARTCHRMYTLLAPALYTKLDLFLEDVGIAADMLPSAIGSVRELYFSTKYSGDDHEATFDILTGLRFPHVTHLAIHTSSHIILFSVMRGCPQLRHLTYIEGLEVIGSFAISKAVSSWAIGRYTCPGHRRPPRYEEFLGEWLLAEAAGAGFVAVSGNWHDAQNVHQVLATELESSSPPRNLLLFDDQSPRRSNINLILIEIDWPLGLDSLKVVMPSMLRDLSGSVYVVHTLSKPEDEKQPAKWEKKIYRKLPADKPWSWNRSWAKELWQEVLEIERRPAIQ